MNVDFLAERDEFMRAMVKTERKPAEKMGDCCRCVSMYLRCTALCERRHAKSIEIFPLLTKNDVDPHGNEHYN